ncbi:hypothetical protein C6341_g11957 [Phytophthora cactorum]|nr:hypothetical protein C6341_g11957 [Phytophthora cactorum]
MVLWDFGVSLRTYDQQQAHRQTVHGEATQARVVPMTCNSDVNKTNAHKAALKEGSKRRSYCRRPEALIYSIRMDENAAFIDEIYDKVKPSSTYLP